MDTCTIKVFSSCVKLFDVYNAGIYHIERLEKRRKKYPSTNAVYFISPNETSIKMMI
jgi:hypothetical protein